MISVLTRGTYPFEIMCLSDDSEIIKERTLRDAVKKWNMYCIRRAYQQDARNKKK